MQAAIVHTCNSRRQNSLAQDYTDSFPAAQCTHLRTAEEKTSSGAWLSNIIGRFNTLIAHVELKYQLRVGKYSSWLFASFTGFHTQVEKCNECWRLLLLYHGPALVMCLQHSVCRPNRNSRLAKQDRRTRGTAVLWRTVAKQPMGLPFSEWADLMAGPARSCPERLFARICLKQQLVSLIDGGFPGPPSPLRAKSSRDFAAKVCNKAILPIRLICRNPG